MATYRPGRLKRMLNRVLGDNPIFALYTTENIYYETDIHEVTIRRGKDGRGGGLNPTTMEVRVKGQLAATLTGTDARFFIREELANRLAEYLDGSASGSNLMFRGTGRVGTIDIEDTGKRFTSTLTTASWTARMLRRISRVTVPMPGQTPADVLMDAVGMTEPTPPAGINMTSHGPFDTVATQQEAINFRDAVTKFGSDIGVCLLETRAGQTRVMSLPNRTQYATDKAAQWMPLVRSQGIAPASWQQSNDAPAIKLNYTITSAAGTLVTRTIDVQTWDPAYETVDVDWSYMKSGSNGTEGQSYQEAYGRVFESSTRIFRMPTVAVDMIHLIGSDKPYHRAVAAQILRMEAGDPVYFSGDWPGVLRGVHFAEGITEKITPDEWRIEFSLSPWAHVLGAASQPEITPRVWESATNQWGQDPRTWQEF